MRPTVVFVGKTRIGEPAGELRQQQFEVFARHLNAIFVGVGPMGKRRVADVAVLTLPDMSPRFLGGIVFYMLAPLFALRLAARNDADAIVCKSPFEGAGVIVARRLLYREGRVRVLVEIHGDWRGATRHYGSRLRALLAPLSDRVASWAVRRADRVRAIGEFSTQLARDAGYRGAVDRYVTYTDVRTFLEPETVGLPPEDVALFVGALEPTKAPDVLLEAWSKVAEAGHDRLLHVVGTGSQEAATKDLASRLGVTQNVRFHGHVSSERVRQLLDASTCLVLPSRQEGLGRIVLEAMARARPVVATAVGGIPELVDHGRTGLLVPPDEPSSLGWAIEQIFQDRELATQMGRYGRARLEEREPLDDYDRGIADLARWAER